MNWFHTIATDMAAGGAFLLVAGIFVLLYLGERGGPAARPTQWEREPRKLFYTLVLFVLSFLVLSLIVAMLLAGNVLRAHVEQITSLTTADVIILIGLLITLEIFMMLTLLKKRK